MKRKGAWPTARCCCQLRPAVIWSLEMLLMLGQFHCNTFQCSVYRSTVQFFMLDTFVEELSIDGFHLWFWSVSWSGLFNGIDEMFGAKHLIQLQLRFQIYRKIQEVNLDCIWMKSTSQTSGNAKMRYLN